MKEIVKIYVLIDPITNRVRYIGRTKCSLPMRLSQHVFRAKNNKIKNNHKDNWIKSLLKLNSRPIIKLLTTVEGWSESHVFEQNLIKKHCIKHNLVNNDDRGEGQFNKKLSQEYKDKISKTLKEGYSSGKIPHPKNKIVYYYNHNGEYCGEFKSIKEASEQLNIVYSNIKKCLRGTQKHAKKYRFSFIKLNQMSKLQ